MNNIIIPCSPKECEQIANGDMSVLVRKTAPREVPFKAYVYCTKKGRPLVYAEPNAYYTEPIMHRTYGRNREEANRIWDTYNGKVAMEFICDKVEKYNPDFEPYGDYEIDDDSILETRLTREQLWDYGKGKSLYGLHLTEVKIYDEPRELYDFANYKKYKACKEKYCFSSDCFICPNNPIVCRPPQSWCYVEKVEE